MTLAGTIPALLTPFGDGGARVDFDALDAHVAWLAERGIRTVSPLGTTGEGPSLSLEERKRVIERLAEHPSGVGLVPGTGCTALPETVELSRFAVERGAAALLIAPPWFYPPGDATGLTVYFERLLASLPGGARVLLYHIPSHTGVPITDDVLRALCASSSALVAGVKDSGGQIDHTRGWVRDFTELSIFNGSDATASEAYRAGCSGTITMLANVFPDELEAIRRGEDGGGRQKFLASVRTLVESLPRHAALKFLLHRVSGLPRSAVRPPLAELDDRQTAHVQARMAELRTEAHV